MNPRIAIVSGLRAGEVFPLSRGEFVIGRDEAADLSIADQSLSRRHCVVSLEDGEYYVQDSRSVNGTTVNGEAVKSRRPLHHADRIGLGNIEMVFLTEQAADIAESVYFDDAPLTVIETIEPARSNALLSTVLEFSNALAAARDAFAIRETLLSFIFAISPADRAAVLLVDREGLQFDSVAGRDRRDAAKSVWVSRTIVERVYKDGAAVVSNNLGASGMDRIESLKAAKVISLVCVPLEAFGRRIGVIYADASDPHAHFDNIHLELLSGVAAIAAIAFQHAVQIERAESENSRLQHDLGIRHELVGDSPAMTEVTRFIAKTAPSNSTVLIQGESGTGKELVARAIHRNSTRSRAPFVAINCAALPENLLESELFGHEKGAFTGALTQKKGLFEVGAGGTVFLDEVAELPPAIQAKLLRVLQEREFLRIGGTRAVKVDVRIVAATNRDLESAVANNTFRQDLYYRLNVVAVRTPPLRERRDDIPTLAQHFLSRFREETARDVRGISSAAIRLLENYDWPGNVRELQNVIERAIVLGSADVLLPEDLPADLIESGDPSETFPTYHDMLNAAKRDLLQKAFAKTGGNLKEAAALLDVNASYVYRLLNNLKLTHLQKRR